MGQTNAFENYIHINDFSYRTAQSGLPTEIRIVHNKDTMAFNQNTYGRYYHGASGPLTHRSLKFIPGYYYFPSWTWQVFDQPPEVTGEVQFENISQSNFIIPEDAYKRYAPTRYQDRRAMESEMDELVIDNFVNGELLIDQKTEHTSISTSLEPYAGPRWQSLFYPTNDSNVYVGFVEYTFNSPNQYISKRVFSEFNKSTNSITHWLPNPSIHRFYLANIYFDAANGILYQTTGIRESDDPNCKTGWDDDCPYTTKMYKSKDDGNTWKRDKTLQNLFETYEFRKFEFIDDAHALAFTRRKVQHSKGYGMQQGTYYLLQNMRVVDSLQTPDDIHYNDNYNRYNFNPQGDTIYLGAWGFVNYDYSKPYVQPLLVKTAKGWGFEITEDSRKAVQARASKEEQVRHYKNFELIENREMVFKNGEGSLTLNRDLADDSSVSGIKVIEKDEQIYITDEYYTLVSFNGGLAWYVYPQPLNKNGNYAFLEIDEANEISFFDLGQMQKQQYRFRKE